MEEVWFHIDGVMRLPNKLIDIDTEKDFVMKHIVSSLIAMMHNGLDYTVLEKQLEVVLSLLPEYKPEDSRINAIVDFITENYSKNISNTAISDHLNLHTDYTGRVFKEKMGITLHKYIVKYRIEKSCSFILENEKIEIVAQKVGYEDPKSFMRAFKLNKGITVSEFKKSRFMQP
jgi:YesN/AraC family two-component response regulator